MLLVVLKNALSMHGPMNVKQYAASVTTVFLYFLKC